MRLGRIGFDHMIGYLEGGLAAVADRPDLLRSTSGSVRHWPPSASPQRRRPY